MEEEKKSKTNVNVRVDSELWGQFIGLSKFLKTDKMELLEEAISEKIKKHQGVR